MHGLIRRSLDFIILDMRRWVYSVTQSSQGDQDSKVVLDRTIVIADDDAHRQEVQAFLDELKPWLHSTDCPSSRAQKKSRNGIPIS